MGLGGKHAIAGIVWLALMGAVYLAISRLTAPKIGYTSSGSEIRIPRSADGHHYVEGTVNGRRLVFLVDTGATVTSIGSAAARALRLDGGKPVSVMTANGTATGEVFSGVTIGLGDILVHRARVIVLPSLGDTALLGQNVIRHLEVVQASDAMVIRPRAGSLP